jgi:hypothetical protein
VAVEIDADTDRRIKALANVRRRRATPLLPPPHSPASGSAPRGLAQFAHPARCPPQIVVDKIESRYTLGGELGR